MTVDADCSGNGASITVNATGGAAALTYRLNGGAWQSSNVFNNAPVGAYVVDVTDGVCGASATGQIVKHCLTIKVDSTNPGCSGNDGTITIIITDGIAPYTYYLNGNPVPTPNITGLVPGIYNINVVDGSTPSQSTFAQVQLQQICIQATVTPGNATCGLNNGTLDINASGGIAPYTYFVDGTSYSTAHVTGLAPGPHSIGVDDSKGNSMLTPVTTTINATPAPTMNATPTAATCVNNDGMMVINGAGGTAPYQYRLDNGGYGSSGTFGNLPSGNHQAYVMDASGCVVNQTVNVPLNDNLTVSAQPNVPVCQGTTGVIQATSNGTTFSWQPTTGLNNPGALQPTVTPTANTTYTLTATLGVCTKTASVNVILNPAPTASAGPGANICNGQATHLHGSGGVGYSWTPTANLDNPTIANPTVSGLTGTTTFQLTVTDANGCKSLNAAYATVTITPPPRVFAGNDTSILLGHSVSLHAVDVDNVGVGGWVWTPNTYLDNDVSQNPIAQPQQSITYLLTGRTFNGCAGTAHITINVYTTFGVFVPNAFTPNGDGNNDVFRPVLVGIKEFKYFAVFDRWGQRVFYTTNAGEGWRGRSNGKDQPMGTYVWMVGVVDYKGTLVQQKGTVLLVR